MKNVIIDKNIRIPGTNIILEKNDKILYEASSYNESELADLLACRAINSDGLPYNEEQEFIVCDGEATDEFYIKDAKSNEVRYSNFYKNIEAAFFVKDTGYIIFKNGKSVKIGYRGFTKR